MNEEFFKEQEHDINYQKLHDDETQDQRKHITKFIIFLNIVFVLQREFAEIM